MAARFAYTNLLQTVGATLVPSSQLTSMPVGNLLKPGASVRWRTASGWTIVAGENDQIFFNRGGIKNATIAAGTYATGALLAVAIVAALTAADATPAWSCDYNVTAVNKFTISTAAHAFVLLFATSGANVAIDIGFATTDTGSATSHTGGSVAYQSRHAVNVDLGSAQSFTAGIVRGHNVSAGTFVLEANATTLVGVGWNASPAPSFVVTLAGTDPRFSFFASQSFRYLRLIITDVQNPAGFNELGVWFLGPYGQTTVLPSIQYQKDNEHLSEIRFADGGAHHTVARTRRRVHKLQFQLEQRGGLAVADRAIFDALDALGIGTNFFTFYDHPDGSVITVYGYLRAGINEVLDRGTVWALNVEVCEALG